MDHVAGNVSEAKVAITRTVGEPFVVKSHEVQSRGVEIVNVHRPFGNVDSVNISRAASDAGHNSPSIESKHQRIARDSSERVPSRERPGFRATGSNRIIRLALSF